MGTDDKKPGLQTQFGDLDSRTTAVEGDTAKIIRRLGEQDTKLLQIETQGRLAIKQVAAQDKELLLVKQTANRTEAKVDRLSERSQDVLELVDLTKKNAKLLEWFVKRALPVLVAIGSGVLWLIKY